MIKKIFTDFIDHYQPLFVMSSCLANVPVES